MKLFVDDRGNVYDFDDESILKRVETISVYNDKGEKFKVNKNDAEKQKLTDEQIKELISHHSHLINMYCKTHPEAACAAPVGAYAACGAPMVTCAANAAPVGACAACAAPVNACATPVNACAACAAACAACAPVNACAACAAACAACAACAATCATPACQPVQWMRRSF